ncbi:MAG: transposase [Promethearchaeota archaeon]
MNKKYNRKSIRLRDYDYSQPGLYFITICTQNKLCLFGQIKNEKMILNNAGEMVKKCWLEIPKHHSNVVLHKYIIMPNHIHGIIEIVGVQNIEPGRKKYKIVGVQNIEPLLRNKFQKIIPGSIGSIVRGFKIGVTKWFHKNTNIKNVWQRNYYEHIIRNKKSYIKITEYIENNPIKWKNDEYYI